MFLDGTHIETSQGTMLLLTGLAQNRAGHILPISVSSAYDENIDTWRRFLKYVLDDLSSAAGLEVNMLEGKYVLSDLALVVADGIKGMTSLVRELFGDRMVRAIFMSVKP